MKNTPLTKKEKAILKRLACHDTLSDAYAKRNLATLKKLHRKRIIRLTQTVWYSADITTPGWVLVHENHLQL